MKPRHTSPNEIIHDWQTTDRVCDRCAGTMGKLEQTPDPRVQLYRCWCGKVTRIELPAPNLLDDIRAAVISMREAPQRQAHLLINAHMLEAVFALPDDERAQACEDVLSLAAGFGLATPILVHTPDFDGPLAQVNDDRTITRL